MALQLEGVGPNGAAHVTSFVAILRACLGVSVTIDANGRVTRGERDGDTPETERTVTELFDEIVNCTVNGRPVTLKILVGSGQTDVTLDLFRRREIDVADLSAFPAAPPAGNPNITTRCEMLAHILAEYLFAMKKGFLTGQQRFNKAHEEGLKAQTRHRQRNGQNGKSKGNEAHPQGTYFRCQYTDGIRTDFSMEHNNITGVR
jgi:hypothetical protein